MFGVPFLLLYIYCTYRFHNVTQCPRFWCITRAEGYIYQFNKHNQRKSINCTLYFLNIHLKCHLCQARCRYSDYTLLTSVTRCHPHPVYIKSLIITVIGFFFFNIHTIHPWIYQHRDFLENDLFLVRASSNAFSLTLMYFEFHFQH